MDKPNFSPIGTLTSTTIRYPSPFFDLSKQYFPRNIKSLFRWCRYFYYRSGVIKSVVSKKSEYPITDIIVDHEDKEMKDLWSNILNKVLFLKPFLVAAGADYFAMGNCIVSVIKPFKRFLKCPKCEKTMLPEKAKDTKWVNYSFKGKCPFCEKDVTFSVKDVSVKDYSRLRLKRWNVDNIDIDYEEVTDTYTYTYKIPPKTRAMIEKGDRTVLNNIPWIFVEAIKKKRNIQMDPNHIFHFKSEGLSETSCEWGKPDVLQALPLVFYLFVLKKAQEAIAVERTVPLRVLFPKGDNHINPFEGINLAGWKTKVEEEVRKWRQDPNYVAVMPIPLGYSNIGGESKALMLTQEIDNTQKEIAVSMGCSIEFVFGGASWSGSSVSLRIIENSFINYREHGLAPLISFIVKEVANFMQITPANVTLSDFKMADDVQRKQLMMNLAQNEVVSNETLLDGMGLDSDKEFEKLEKEIDKQAEIAKKKALQEVVIKGEQQLKEIDYRKKIAQAQREKQPEGDMESMMRSWLEELKGMGPEEQQQALEQLSGEMPGVAQYLSEAMAQEGGQQEQEEEPSTDMRPAPDQKPPRRENTAM